jgi:hypothetical protein
VSREEAFRSEPRSVKQTLFTGRYLGTAATYDVAADIEARLRASAVMRGVVDEVVGGFARLMRRGQYLQPLDTSYVSKPKPHSHVLWL